jgi:hypothetical protein
MSYDISFYSHKCTCGNGHDQIFDRNYTYNIAGIAKEAGFSVRDFDDKSGAEIVAILEPAIERMQKDPEHFRQFEPSNGWGDFDTFLELLESLLTITKKNPNGYCHIH